MKKQKRKNPTSIVTAIVIGIILGLAAKLVDVPELTYRLHVLDDIGSRFGIWIFAATLLSVRSKTPGHAAGRVFCFFASMLLTYYVYTVLFLGFYPKSQIILWSAVSLLSPFCAFIIWYAGISIRTSTRPASRWNKAAADSLAALPVAFIFSEWYVTGWKNTALLIAYLAMIICLIIYVPGTARRRISVMLTASVTTLLLTLTGFMDYICGKLLNI